MPWAQMIAADEQRMIDGYRMAIELGVKIAAGTDVGGNISHVYGDSALELEVLRPLRDVAAATRSPRARCERRRAINARRTVGSIEPGKLADLVVIDGDPLSDITLVPHRRRRRSSRAARRTATTSGLFVGLRAPAPASAPV